ncbi:deazaflavin-dependent oxidoreductase, nitroreductase family [Mycolicibacterium rutilum]|uniref:Deazaflavin-dependent oxidoreductase, nitroreductase family n=1 Tax=Mycolicibacterium rutilum TaxID=370526 RepID=A0A1H6ID98_MYCRU|nr:nitroreductase/quinone reductase family protein [Mycolicibacterium rutilum]SEH47287.1 deazaflavin-dependent oxidoreductase, nitroreductase family [Mycolicibacterium rutilum]
MTAPNDLVIAEFRANGGAVVEAMGGHFKEVHLLLLHHTGTRTGRRYVTPLIYVADGDSYVLVGSNGGAAKEPAWVANLAAVPETVVEVGERTLTVRPTVLRAGPEWDRLHRLAVDYWPDLVEYQSHTDRTFPLVVLTPLTG